MLIKKITLLTMLLVLFCGAAFAQKDLRLSHMGNAQSPSPAFKCIDRQTQSARKTIKLAGAELVTPPASAQVETWYTTNGKFMANSPYGLFLRFQ